MPLLLHGFVCIAMLASAAATTCQEAGTCQALEDTNIMLQTPVRHHSHVDEAKLDELDEFSSVIEDADEKDDDAEVTEVEEENTGATKKKKVALQEEDADEEEDEKEEGSFSWFLAQGGTSCDQACAVQSGACDVNALKQVGQSVAKCKKAVKDLGITVAFAEQYDDDNSGCTFHPDSIVNSKHGDALLMRKNGNWGAGGDPQCNVINDDKARQRLCKCKKVAKGQWFLAQGKTSCDKACKGNGQCDGNALKEVGKSVAQCQAAIEGLGMQVAFAEQYADDNSGCTYHPNSIVDSVHGDALLMRKNDNWGAGGDPQCNVINDDKARQRLCKCK